MMARQAVSYSIIRFRPYVETEEFVNVGIVLVAPELGYLDFRLETKNIGRLTSFFENLDHCVIHSVLKGLNLELERVRDTVGLLDDDQAGSTFNPRGNAEHLFDALTKDREGIIRFSDVRVALTNDPKSKLDELFALYVKHNVATKTQRERVLEA
jgi:hypothetical protein